MTHPDPQSAARGHPRTFKRLIALSVIPAIAVAAISAQNKTTEDGPPVATAPVQQFLDQAAVASTAGDASKALEFADRALVLARDAADVIGEAYARRLRAQQLIKLDRSADARAEWRETEEAWQRLGDAPGQVEALGWQAVLDIRGNAEQGAALLRRAITLAEAEIRRPRAVVSALVSVGRALVDISLLNEPRQVFESAATIAERAAPGSLELAATLNALGDVAYNRSDLRAARDYAEQSLAIREKLAPGSLDVAASLNSLGRAIFLQGDLTNAQTCFHKALLIHNKLAPNSLLEATTLTNLGNVARWRGDLAAANDLYSRGFLIREKLAPNSLVVAASLYSLGIVRADLSDLNGAHDLYRRSLEIREKIVPHSLEVASSLNALGLVSLEQGDFTSARDYHERALGIRLKLSPNSLDTVTSLNNLGNLSAERGDLAKARDYYQRSLAIVGVLAPESSYMADGLNNVGTVVQDQGDLSGAREYYLRALEIREKLAPNSLRVAGSLNNLGNVAEEQGDFDVAEGYHRRALMIRERLAPGTLAVAASLNNLGNVALDRHDLAGATAYHKQALAIRDKVAPNSLDAAESLSNLGRIALAQNEVGLAAEYYQRALAIREKVGPSSLDMAVSLRDLAAIASRQRNLASAVQLGERAWAIVRAQAATVAGDEAHQAFQSRYQTVGGQLVRFQVALGNVERAFLTLEEGRAQALLQLIIQRGIGLRIAPADVWQRYELAQAASNRAGTALENAASATARAKLALDTEMALKSQAHEIHEKRRIADDSEQILEKARQAYTRLRVEAEQGWADVSHSIRAVVPPPLGVADARRVLPPDTVLAAFAVGAEASTLFVVTRDGPIRAFPLEISLEQLEARVKYVREAVSRESGTRGLSVPGAEEERIAAARRLFMQLFPAEARKAVLTAKRLLLSPDNVLWNLPFAALVVNEQGNPQYLGLEIPLLYTQSLTTFAQTLQGRATPSSRKPNVVIVGNPLYDNTLRTTRRGRTSGTSAASPSQSVSAKTRAEGELALLARAGEVPAPLPHAEEEALQVAALYGVRAATATEPTETWFRQRAPDADIIHLATHGYFNQFRAVSSGVRLAVPEIAPGPGETDNDGALQAWEVFTQLQLRAELVVLSACETGVGAQVPGEGLVGLTRAFQVAGARSIVATQWKVADRSTARGMVSLHQGLLKGLTKDEALRTAMRKLAADPVTSDPYYWAPFILIGGFRPIDAMPSR